jgi:transposase
VRQERVKPLVDALKAWMRTERARLSRHADIAKPIDYMLKRWPAFTRFLDDGRICLSNKAAERALRGIALGRRAWLFAGSDRGGERAAAMYTLIATAKLNGVDPQAWLADILRRIADHPASQLPNYAYDLGATDSGMSFERLRELSKIHDRAALANADPDFSARIRDGVPTPH